MYLMFSFHQVDFVFSQHIATMGVFRFLQMMHALKTLFFPTLAPHRDLN